MGINYIVSCAKKASQDVKQAIDLRADNLVRNLD